MSKGCGVAVVAGVGGSERAGSKAAGRPMDIF